jgi:uncharacterized membrane protein YedE/YeeE
MRQMGRDRGDIEDLPREDDRDVAKEAVGYHYVERAPWSPAQLVVLAIGLTLAIIGGIGLARTGLVFDHIPGTRTQVAGLHHTSLSALIELGVGVILMGIGAVPAAERGLMATFGALLFGAGIVIGVQPSSFHKWLGYDEGNGVFLAVLGAVLLVSAMLSPVLWSSHRRMGREVDRHRQVSDRDSFSHR